MAWSKTEPTGDGDFSLRDDAIRANFAAIETVVGADKLAGPTALNDRIVQVVNYQTGAVATGTTILPVDDTIPQKTEGDQYMTLDITPTSASNKLLIEVIWNGAQSVNNYLSAALFQDTTSDALITATAGVQINANTPVQIKILHYMTAGTTSKTTFKVRAGSSGAATTTFNGQYGERRFGGRLLSSITITEIKA